MKLCRYPHRETGLECENEYGHEGWCYARPGVVWLRSTFREEVNGVINDWLAGLGASNASGGAAAPRSENSGAGSSGEKERGG